MIITLMYWPPRRRSNCTGSRTAPKPYRLGRTMASDRRLVPTSTCGVAWRTAPCTAACVSGRGIVGTHQRRTLARFSRAVSQSYNVLAAASRMDRRRRVPDGLATFAQQTRSLQAHQLGRSNRRWLVFTGKKRAPRSATVIKVRARPSC